MRTLKFLAVIVAISTASLAAEAQQPAGALGQVVAKIIAREDQEMEIIRGYSPLVETYIQRVSNPKNKEAGWEPDGDRYFMGRAELSKGLNLKPVETRNGNPAHRAFVNLVGLFDFAMEFLPQGFLQMIYLDNNGLDAQAYDFQYVRREFLGEVRTLVFDVTPLKKTGKGRFVGRIWVEDEAFTIVRFNGTYSGNYNSYFHFDSWRVNAGPNLWLPGFIYSEESSPKYLAARTASAKAQTRLWGYNIGPERVEQELSKVLIEADKPVVDKSQQNTDLSPVEEKREWDLQAQNNIIERLQREGLIAPTGEVDKILDTVVNNLEVTNNLVFEPEVRCRVLLTSTLESFSIGRTIVLSRGLIDVLPDEATLAAMIARELGHVILGHKTDTRFAFYDRVIRFDDPKSFPHFDFARSRQEDAAATAKAGELLKNSPYRNQLRTAEMFIAELQKRSKQIPSLISPRLGESILVNPAIAADTEDKPEANQIVALPLGGRVKMDPWDDTLELLKSQPAPNITEREKMPFEVTPFALYLTRVPKENPKPS
jgi:hypothetical protein